MSTSIKPVVNVLILMLCALLGSAQNVIEVNAPLQDVTIYGRGATLHHTTKQVVVPAGSSEIVINQIAQQVDPESIRITTGNANITILSVSFERDYLVKGENKSALFLEVKKKYDQANAALNALINERKGEESTLALLEENRKFGGQTGVTPASITTMIKYYREQYKVIADNILMIKAKEEAQQKIVERLKSQMEEAGGTGQNAGQLVVRINASQGVNTDFNVNYFTNDVSWSPFYEIRVDQLNEPLQLVYKASVYQNTGIDWKKIRLTFASGNPKQNNNAPILQPWWVSFRQPIVLQGRALSAASKRMELESVASDFSNQNMAQIQDNQLSTAFVIATPYDVYSNGKAQSVQLQSYSLPAQYFYFTAPRLDENAFLIGRITDWEKLNLLPGNANLIIDNNYAGSSFIDSKSTSDTLVLSLGRDERIVTKREQVNEVGSTSFLANSQSRVYTYEISVRNTRKEAVYLEVKEQYPLSTEKDIEIKLLEISNAKVDGVKGELTWNLHLNAGETKKLRVSYSVKTPKDKVISGL